MPPHQSVPEAPIAPGAGWHRVGSCIPGSENDLIARRERAFRCFVLPMRDRGERLTGAALASCSPIEGGLLMMDRLAGPPVWDAYLFTLPGMMHELMVLTDARLVREHDGCRQYQGLQRGAQTRWPQTWLCTPTAERAREIAQLMAERDWR